jgi:hypothetical protein
MTYKESAPENDTETEAAYFGGARLAGQVGLPLVVAIAVLMALNAGIFRLFDYYYWVNPNSTMGSIVQAEDLVRHRIVAGKKNIVVIGDSRVSEGFSPEIANASIRRTDVNFIQSGIPGSSPRAWFYFLRTVDPQRKNFSAIVLMVARLDDRYERNDAVSRDDLTDLQPLTTFVDAPVIASDYPDNQEKVHAWAAMLLPMLAAREDLFDFARDPKKRITAVTLWHSDFYKWVSTYRGHPNRLPTLNRNELGSFNFSAMGLNPPQLAQMEKHLGRIDGSLTDTTFEVTSGYRKKWYGAIADAYRRANVPVFVFEVPRGPYEAFATVADSAAPSGALPALAREKRLIALDAAPFEALERPEYFFDALHLNTTGRMLLSPVLADLVTRHLPESH